MGCLAVSETTPEESHRQPKSQTEHLWLCDSLFMDSYNKSMEYSFTNVMEKKILPKTESGHLFAGWMIILCLLVFLILPLWSPMQCKKKITIFPVWA